MSKIKKQLELVPPKVKLAKELHVSKGHVCGYCSGNGWFWNCSNIGEREKKNCPACQGTGEVYALITVEWKPGKEVKLDKRE